MKYLETKVFSINDSFFFENRGKILDAKVVQGVQKEFVFIERYLDFIPLKYTMLEDNSYVIRAEFQFHEYVEGISNTNVVFDLWLTPDNQIEIDEVYGGTCEIKQFGNAEKIREVLAYWFETRRFKDWVLAEVCLNVGPGDGKEEERRQRFISELGNINQKSIKSIQLKDYNGNLIK